MLHYNGKAFITDLCLAEYSGWSMNIKRITTKLSNPVPTSLRVVRIMPAVILPLGEILIFSQQMRNIIMLPNVLFCFKEGYTKVLRDMVA